MGELERLNYPEIGVTHEGIQETSENSREYQALFGPDSLHIIYPDYARGMIRKQFADNPEGQHIRERMWRKVSAVQRGIKDYRGPDIVFGVGGLMHAIREISPVAFHEFSTEKGTGLGAHLKEIRQFSRSLFLTEDNKSRFPDVLDDRQAQLLTHVAAPIHDLAKYFDPTHTAQIIPDHEAIIAALVRNTFEGKNITLDNDTSLTLTHEDVEFIAGVVGDHENIYKEEGRRNFASSPSPIERAKALFFIADTMTGVIQERDGIFYIDEDMLEERFGDLMERHLDGAKEHRPEWVVSTVEDILNTLDILQSQENHSLLLGPDKNGRSVRQQILESATGAFKRVREGKVTLPPGVNEIDYRQTLDDNHARLNDMLAQEEVLAEDIKNSVASLQPQQQNRFYATLQQTQAVYRQQLQRIGRPLDDVPSLINFERTMVFEKMLPTVLRAIGRQDVEIGLIFKILNKIGSADMQYITALQENREFPSKERRDGSLSFLETEMITPVIGLLRTLYSVERNPNNWDLAGLEIIHETAKGEMLRNGLKEVDSLISTEGALDSVKLNILKEQLHDDWRDKSREKMLGKDDEGNDIYLHNSDGSIKRQPRPKVDGRTTSDAAWMAEAQTRVDEFVNRGRQADKITDSGKEFLVFDNIVVDEDKKVIGCDIANTAGRNLPEGWRNEQLKAAQVALAVAGLVKNGDLTPEEGAEIIHIKWIEFNPWAPEDQKVSFGQLSEGERQKDRDQLDLALGLVNS